MLKGANWLLVAVFVLVYIFYFLCPDKIHNLFMIFNSKITPKTTPFSSYKRAGFKTFDFGQGQDKFFRTGDLDPAKQDS